MNQMRADFEALHMPVEPNQIDQKYETVKQESVQRFNERLQKYTDSAVFSQELNSLEVCMQRITRSYSSRK